MPIDVEAMRRKVERSYHILRGSITGNLEYVTPKDALEMIEEIEQLRAQVVELEEQLRVLAEGSEEDDLIILPTPISFDVIERYTKAMKGNVTGTETRPDLAGTESDVDA